MEKKKQTRVDTKNAKTAIQHFADFISQFRDPKETFSIHLTKKSFTLTQTGKRKPRK